MRIFIAIPATSEIIKLSTQFRNKSDLPELRWMETDGLHITLIPPFEIKPEELPEIIDLLQDHERLDPFEVAFQEISLGPTSKEPRLIWITSHAPESLLLLKNNLEHLLGYRPDRKLLAHLTLARFKPKDLSAISKIFLPESIHWNMLVDSFVIMQSELTKTGSKFTTLHTFNLYE